MKIRSLIFVPVTWALTALLSSSALASGPDILYIGDSHSVGIFGQNFDKLLRSFPESKVNFFAYVGASPAWYSGHYSTRTQYLEQDERGVISETHFAPVTVTDPVSGKKITKEMPAGGPRAVPDFNQMLLTKKPTIAVIELGANLYFHPSASAAVKAQAKAQLEKMAEEVTSKKIPCYWIGPPDTIAKGSRADQVAFDRFVEAVVTPAGCTYFHSIDVTTYRPFPGCDGLHYWGKAGMLEACHWAQKVFKDFKKVSSLSGTSEEDQICTKYSE